MGVYSAWASALSFYWKGNAKASMCGTTTVELHAFFVVFNNKE